MLKKYSTPMLLLMTLILFASMWKFASAAPVVGVLLLLISLGVAVAFIFEKHKGADNSRLKIVKDVLLLVITLILILFFGGLAGLFANAYASPRFGAAVGFIFAIIASFVVGYLVKKGVYRIKEFHMRARR